jgi:hypothetical protein
MLNYRFGREATSGHAPTFADLCSLLVLDPPEPRNR